MTLSLAISSTLRRLWRRPTATEGQTMPTTVAAARPDWRLAQGRSWVPVYDEPQSIERQYVEGWTVYHTLFMPGMALVTEYQRNEDGSRGAFIQRYQLPEADAAWPTTKTLIESVT